MTDRESKESDGCVTPMSDMPMSDFAFGVAGSKSIGYADGRVPTPSTSPALAQLPQNFSGPQVTHQTNAELLSDPPTEAVPCPSPASEDDCRDYTPPYPASNGPMPFQTFISGRRMSLDETRVPTYGQSTGGSQSCTQQRRMSTASLGGKMAAIVEEDTTRVQPRDPKAHISYDLKPLNTNKVIHRMANGLEVPMVSTMADFLGRRHSTPDERMFVCRYMGCMRHFSNEYQFKLHMRLHTDNEQQSLVCMHSSCNKQFTSYSKFKIHARLHEAAESEADKGCAKGDEENSAANPAPAQPKRGRPFKADTKKVGSPSANVLPLGELTMAGTLRKSKAGRKPKKLFAGESLSARESDVAGKRRVSHCGLSIESSSALAPATSEDEQKQYVSDHSFSSTLQSEPHVESCLIFAEDDFESAKTVQKAVLESLLEEDQRCGPSDSHYRYLYHSPSVQKFFLKGKTKTLSSHLINVKLEYLTEEYSLLQRMKRFIS